MSETKKIKIPFKFWISLFIIFIINLTAIVYNGSSLEVNFTFLWTFSLFLLVYAFRIFPHSPVTKRDAFSVKKVIYEYSLIAIICLIFLFILSYDLSNNPPGFFCDEAILGVEARSIITTLKDSIDHYTFPLWFHGIGTGSSLPGVTIYLLVPFIYLFGLTIFATRFLMAFCGIFSLFGLYLLAKELFNKKIALLSSLLFAISPWFLHNFRVAQTFNALPPFLLFSLFFLLKGVKDNKFSYYFIGLFLTGITFHTYPSVFLSFPLMLVLFLLLYFKKIFSNKKFLISGIVVSFVFLVSFYFILSNPIHMRRAKQRDLSNKINMETIKKGYIPSFSEYFLFVEGDNFGRNTPNGWGVYPHFFMPFLLIGLIALLINFKKESSLLLVWLLVYPFGGFDIASETQNIFGMPVFPLITAVGIYSLFYFIYHALSRLPLIKKGFSLFYWGLIVFLSLNSLKNFLIDYHVDYKNYAYDTQKSGWQYGPEKIIEKFKNLYDQYDQFFMTHRSINAPDVFFKFFSPDKNEKMIIALNELYDPNKKQLFAEHPFFIDDIENNKAIKVVDRIYAPDNSGKTIFYLFEFEKSFYANPLKQWLSLGLLPVDTLPKENSIEKDFFENNYKYNNENIAWKITEQPENQRYDLIQNYFYSSYKKESGCAYIAFNINSKEEKNFQFRINNPLGPTKIYLNKKLIYQLQTAQPVITLYDAVKIEAELKKGTNPVLVGACNLRNDWWLYNIRITDKDGKNLSDIEYSLPKI